MKHYIVGSEVLAREDRQTEFKGHKNITIDDIPPWFKINRQRKSQSPISRALCGFLNTGEGGSVLVGVTDSGRVLATTYSPEEKDHLVKSIQNTLNHFSPPVSSRQWEARFVPALPGILPVEVELEQHKQLERLSAEAVEEYHGGDPPSNLGQHRIPLSLGSNFQRCWCERNAMDLRNKGVKLPSYVAEIVMLPFQPRSPLQLWPCYQDEQGTAYLRLTASLRPLSYQDVADLTRQEIASLKHRLRIQ